MPGKVLFSVLMLALAALHKWNGFDSISVGLGVAAGLPWILSDLQRMFTSVSVNGVFDMKFRDIKEQLALQQNAIDHGAGGKVPVLAASQALQAATATAGGPGKSLSSPSADADPIADAIDPNKGKFGSSPESRGVALTAKVIPFPGSDALFRLQMQVAATDTVRALASADKVRFYLNATFQPSEVDVAPDASGIATLERVAREAFTLGAKVETRGQVIRLELDLAPQFPKR